jgi:hypothetical protein
MALRKQADIKTPSEQIAFDETLLLNISNENMHVNR